MSETKSIRFGGAFSRKHGFTLAAGAAGLATLGLYGLSVHGDGTSDADKDTGNDFAKSHETAGTKSSGLSDRILAGYVKKAVGNAASGIADRKSGMQTETVDAARNDLAFLASPQPPVPMDTESEAAFDAAETEQAAPLISPPVLRTELLPPRPFIAITPPAMVTDASSAQPESAVAGPDGKIPPATADAVALASSDTAKEGEANASHALASANTILLKNFPLQCW